MELRPCRLKQPEVGWSVFLSGPELYDCHFSVISTGIEEGALLVVLLG